MSVEPTPEQLRGAAAWLDDIDLVGDGPDGPVYILRDGTVVTVEAVLGLT